MSLAMMPLHENAASLQRALETKTKEAELLELQIQSTRLEAQMWRLRLQILGVKDESLIPAVLGTGNTLEANNEHRRLLEWLAEHIDFSSRRTCCVVGDLDIAGSLAVIGHGVQWTLRNTEGLNLTIPRDVEHVVLDLLCKARRGLLSNIDLDKLAVAWDLLSVEMCSDGDMIPGLFLLRREDSAAIVISTWPKLPQPTSEVWRGRPFSASSFFQESANIEQEPTIIAFASPDGATHSVVFREGRTEWCMEGVGSRQFHELGISFTASNAVIEEEQLCLSGPFGCVVIADTSDDQRELLHEIVAACLEHGVHVHHERLEHMHQDVVSEASPMTSADLLAGPRLPDFGFSDVTMGDNVEVHFEGQWFTGVLQGIDGEFAIVSCDVDDPDIITVAPLRKVRAASYDDNEGAHSINESVSQ
jgi:hypothetical protein